jgi:hypothetical protein
MTSISLSATEVLAVVGVLVVLLLVWRAGVRHARATIRAARASTRLVSLASPVVVNAALIVIAQWMVISYVEDVWLRLAALAGPALLASYTLTRALTVTTVDLDRHHREGGRR